MTGREWRTVNDVIDGHPEGDLTLKKRSPIHGSKNRPVFKKGNHFPEYVGGDESDLPRKSTGVDSAANRQAIPRADIQTCERLVPFQQGRTLFKCLGFVVVGLDDLKYFAALAELTVRTAETLSLFAMSLHLQEARDHCDMRSRGDKLAH